MEVRLCLPTPHTLQAPSFGPARRVSKCTPVYLLICLRLFHICISFCIWVSGRLLHRLELSKGKNKQKAGEKSNFPLSVNSRTRYTRKKREGGAWGLGLRNHVPLEMRTSVRKKWQTWPPKPCHLTAHDLETEPDGLPATTPSPEMTANSLG